jgi:hypothetical protein
MKTKYIIAAIIYFVFSFKVIAQVDPDTAQKAMIDRFSPQAGHLFVRDSSNGLPGPNMPVDFDKAPFFAEGFGPRGQLISYYNFDVQPTKPAPIYVLFKDGESMPVVGQMNIVNVIPGDTGYNDFWQVYKVTVPQNYVANTVTSYDEIMNAGYTVQPTNLLVNCPIVPDSSTAGMRLNGESPALNMGWYKNMVVYYFTFSEKSLTTDDSGMVPLSPIYVTFNINPGMPGGGPPSGFMTDTVTGRHHNVTATLPADSDYSPLWAVNIYDNMDFNTVHDLMSARSAHILATDAANVNCPIVQLANIASIDRFSAQAGHLFVRDSSNGLPGPNMSVDFDSGPFYAEGFGPKGELISYYNFDVQSTKPAPIYVLFKNGESMPVAGQMNIINVIPGDTGYNDFWQVVKVTVPQDYMANTMTSYDGLMNAGYTMQLTNMLVNCPVVPEGSTAKMRLNAEDPGLQMGWYKGKVVYYFSFTEKSIITDDSGMVPLSPIYVTFNINPGMPGGGPPSGFMSDSTGRHHNVTATLPADSDYSPLWAVNIYDNADFNMVHDLMSAQSANILATDAANVNCPVVSMQMTTAIRGNNNAALPKKYTLYQNYPNPFNPSTVINYDLQKSGLVIMKIYDVLGREVKTLVNQVQSSGQHSVVFNASNFASGVYFYRLKAGNFVSLKKMILLK